MTQGDKKAIRATFRTANTLLIIAENSTAIGLTIKELSLLKLRYADNLSWIEIEERLYMSKSSLFRLEQQIIEKIYYIC